MRDYANRSHPPKKNRLSTVMLILAFVFAGLAVFHYIHKHMPIQLPVKKLISPKETHPKTHSEVHSKVHPKAHVKVHAKAHPKKTKPAVTTTAVNQPKFDFYKLLPEMTVTIPTKDDAANNRAKS